MGISRIQYVSNIFKVNSNKDSISFGFTITYDNGEIQNWIMQSKEDQKDEAMNKVESERQKWIKKMCLKKED